MTQTRNRAGLPLVAAVLLHAGCGVAVWDTHKVPGGVLATEGVTLVAEGSLTRPPPVPPFTFRAGVPFVTPFSINFCPDPRPDKWRSALALEAKRVRVHYPGLTKPLYGVLALCRVHDSATGAASASYRIQIPPKYVEATTDGRVAVVWEESGATHPEMKDAPSWILWLSRELLLHGDLGE